MKTTVKRLAVLAALGAMGVAGPATSASAATMPSLAGGFPLAVPTFPVAAGLWGFGTSPVGYVGPGVAGPAVIGPAVITTAPSSFINTNIQVSAAGNFSGGQFGP